MPSEADSLAAIRGEVLAGELTSFARRTAHEMVGPLNQAGSLLSLFIARYQNRLDAEADTLLALLQRSAARIQAASTGLHKYLDVAGAPCQCEPVDLNAALDIAQESLAKAVADTGTIISSEILPVVDGDMKKMVTVFEILLENAVKFRKPSAPAQVRIWSKEAGKERMLVVEDNGIGIDPQYHEAVLLPFQKVHGMDYPGAGLGLSIARLIVRLHGGEVRVGAAENGGTKVSFTVQARRPDAISPGAQ